MIELKRRNVFKVVSTPDEAEFLIGQGYEIVSQPQKAEEKPVMTEEKPLTENKEEDVKVDYRSMTMAQLKATAKKLKVKGFNSLSKEALIMVLESL